MVSKGTFDTHIIYMGYKVTVYDNLGREIDFLAEKGNYRYYIQVAYSVAEEKTYQREMSAFNGLSQLKLILQDMTELPNSKALVRQDYQKMI